MENLFFEDFEMVELESIDTPASYNAGLAAGITTGVGLIAVGAVLAD